MDTLYDRMKNVRKKFSTKNVDQLLSDTNECEVIIKGICDLSDEKASESLNGSFGTAGNYHLVKGLKSSQSTDYETEVASERICKKLICDAKVRDGRDYARWKDLMNDLLTTSKIHSPSESFHREIPGFMFDWIPQIRMLNLQAHIEISPKNRFSLKPFRPDYQKYFKHSKMENLQKELRSLNVDPKLIVLTFGKYRAVRIHPGFYYNVARTLKQAAKTGEFALEEDFIYFYPQTFSLPNLSKPKNKYPFLINGVNKMYILKSIAVILVKETTMKISEIPTYKNMDENTQMAVNVCVATTEEEIKNLLRERNLQNLIPFMEDITIDIYLLLRKICSFLKLDGITKFGTGNHSIHTFALIVKNERWIIMNDEFSCYVDDINTFTTMLKDETISSVLFEE
ncbi:hypothetical protein SNEBB_007161 [Seison nebaliae]|nr:hypothetical protein SNEBB_007161 [Seison nebaliae]